MHSAAARPPEQFRFDPPLTLRGDIVVHTLEDAAVFARSYPTPRLPKGRDSVLRWIDRAATEDQQRKTADLFRTWAGSEGALMEAAQRLEPHAGGLQVQDQILGLDGGGWS